jgi:hypothetical protein
MRKQPYRPFHVYKILMKIAMSVIDEADVLHYPRLLQFLVKNENSTVMTDYAQAMYYSMSDSLHMGKPVVILFRKRDVNASLPTHCLSLYFEHYMYTFPIPWYEPDWMLGIYKKDIRIPLPPPMYSDET